MICITLLKIGLVHPISLIEKLLKRCGNKVCEELEERRIDHHDSVNGVESEWHSHANNPCLSTSSIVLTINSRFIDYKRLIVINCFLKKILCCNRLCKFCTDRGMTVAEITGCFVIGSNKCCTERN